MTGYLRLVRSAYHYHRAHSYIRWESRVAVALGFALIFGGLALGGGGWMAWGFAVAFPMLALYGLVVEVDEHRSRLARGDE